MRILLRSLLVLAFVGLFGTANAQFQLGFNVNGVAPVAPSGISDAINFGFGGTAVARYGLNDNLRLGLDLGYYSFSSKIDGVSSSYLVPIQVGVEYSFTTEGFMPYAAFKTGLFIGGSNQEGAESTTNFGLTPTLGFRYGLSDAIDLDFNFGYQVFFTEGDASGNLPIGLGLVFKLN